MINPKNATALRPVGTLLREWRQRRRMSQLDFATEAEISTRHLSFVETGRAQPSREMLMRLSELLDVPLRERNELLVAAGFAPVFAARSLDDPALQAARRAVDLVLKGHEPYPALAVDRHWNLVAANRMVGLLMSSASPELLQPPINVLRLTLHPQGIAPIIANAAQWREHLFARLRRQIEVSADAVLNDLLKELTTYPSAAPPKRSDVTAHGSDVIVPLSLTTPHGTLNFISTTTVFGTPIDVTLAELAIEAFFPADQATADILRQMAS
ncbi:transcriptional regulator with XRE-family HTH domain [Povalibacter uvarum]|uniref:Transcriptional regulator with XRE-family HTH domain n=1 Tax=Povalibacter uvarum TaxID=732238 RepID=A0A841HQX2_9GAMM|nr:helix-turn-helix transcriptional regulator [Povalibacter uvarum]MBB6095751.1 transcriptional regulator with XRE-family HTH domain [Povalibacter uvarum]